MAILDGATVKVRVNGKYAREFDDDEELDDGHPNTITKYVEAVSGAPFAFDVEVSGVDVGPEECLAVYVFLDGTMGAGRIIASRKLNAINRTTLSGRHVGDRENHQFYQFHFRDLETRELTRDDDMASFKSKYDKFGIMEVRISKAVDCGVSDKPAAAISQPVGSIPEKALKGRPLDVSTELKPSTGEPFEPLRLVRHLGDKPAFRFIFKYRTKKALQTLMIIPRSPTPDPIDEMSPEEMRNELRRQREIKQERGVKRERASTGSVRARPLKTSRMDDGKLLLHLDSDNEDVPGDFKEDPWSTVNGYVEVYDDSDEEMGKAVGLAAPSSDAEDGNAVGVPKSESS